MFTDLAGAGPGLGLSVFARPHRRCRAECRPGVGIRLTEASRLSLASREEHRRAEILAEVAQALHAVPDAAAVIEAVADRLRVLLGTRLVCVLLREGGTFSLRAVAAESPQLASWVRARHDRKGLYFAADLANRAVTAGEPVTVSIEPTSHSLGDLVPAGALIAAPFRTSDTCSGNPNLPEARSSSCSIAWPSPLGPCEEAADL